MKKIIFETLGAPADVLKVTEVELPQPGAGEVRIKVKASPVNPSDVMFVQGFYGLKPQLPSGAGFEGAGVIDAVGEGVKLAAGTSVSFITVGAWSEYAIAPAQQVLALPPNMPFETGAQVFVNPITAFAMLHESGLKEGEWLLLTAGGSTFGQLVIQAASKKGIKVIATVRREDQVELLKGLGCTEVINTATENLPKRVRQITEGKGVRCCFDAVGGEQATEALNSLAYRGTMLVYGLMSLQDTPMNNGVMIFKELTIKGFWLTSWMGHADKAVVQQVIKEVVTMLATNEVKINVEATYPLEQAVEAVAYANAPGRNGKVLISMN